MSTTKVTLALDTEQLDQIRALIAAKGAPNLSAFVRHAIRIALEDAAGWKTALNESLEQTGGPLTPIEREWADSMLDLGKGQKTSPKRQNVA